MFSLLPCARLQSRHFSSCMKGRRQLIGTWTSMSSMGSKEKTGFVPKMNARFFCDKNGAKPTAAHVTEGAAPATDAIVLTPYEKVAATARGGMYLGFAGLAVVCGYFISAQLIPSRMNPNSLFNEASDELIANSEIATVLGSPIRSYGRDHGGHREGRRNIIEHVMLKDKDGTPRLRIRFNLKGPHGVAYGFAEVRKGMPKGEWVYLMAQFQRGGQVVTIQDNRHILKAESKEEEDALRQLLGGGNDRYS